jgi:hypothetical protein
LKHRPLFIIGLVVACISLLLWRADVTTFGVIAPDVTYDSPAGQFTLPTVDATAGTLGLDYQLATFFFGVPKTGQVAGDINSTTGNGFADRYGFENLNAFSLGQAGSNIGDRDSLDPNNAVLGPGGQPINPGFRFVHPEERPFIWRIGTDTDSQQAQQVIVFPSIDHLFDPEVPGYGPNRMNPPVGGLGNVVLEALEFTVWGTNDRNEAIVAAQTANYFGTGGTGVLPANGKWFRARLVKVLAEGFKDFNGLSPFANLPEGSGPSPQEGDDFASCWEFRDQSGNPVPVKYVAVFSNRTRDARFFVPDAQGLIPGVIAQSVDAEIDAVGFIPFTPPPAASGSISGRVINDANGNGAIDPGEVPIPGVTVTLFNGTGANSLAVTTTNASGSYSFPNLLAGNYRVVETNLPGYLDTGVLPGAGNTALNLNTIAVTLATAQNSVENNFLDALPPPDCVPACFNDAEMWALNFKARQEAYQKAGGIGKIFLLTLNRGAADDDEVLAVLESFDGGKASLDREFVTAQLNTFTYPGTIFNRATCFYNGPNAPVRLPGNPRLLDVMLSARTVFATGTLTQIRTVTFQLALFNNLTATMGIICPFADP